MLRLASLITITAFCALTAVPSARSEGVLTSVASELARSGAKAAIAHFAPDIAKHVDPTSHQLAGTPSGRTAIARSATTATTSRGAAGG